MSGYSSSPMYAYAWSDPHVDLDNPRFVISVEWTWPEGDWSHFSIVRSTRSPATRREEGQVLMETKGRVWDQFAYRTTGLPVYRDPQPPPGEWVYYTAFVLDPNRVWSRAGYIYEVSIADYDWALRLPEIFPGVAIANASRTISPPEQSNDLVQFLQTPGALLDKVVTMGETAQYFWDPLRVPPQMLQAMTESLGYKYDEAIGSGRFRHVIASLMGPQQGSLTSVRNFAAGVTGCDARAEISNNLMLDLNDSSFENGLLTQIEPDGSTTVVTKWQPLEKLELREYANWGSAVAGGSDPVLHPNVVVGWYLYLKEAGTYTCGPNYTSTTVPNPTVAQQGIPVVDWTEARMGIHAYKPSAGAVNISLGLKLYDYLGRFLRDVTILEAQPTTEDWAWYGNADDSAVSMGDPGFAYAVPWVAVSNPCSVDLLVVDDG